MNDDLKAEISKALEPLRVLETPDNPGFLKKLVDVFLTDTPQLMATAFSALEKNDPATLARMSHSLKSNFASFGAKKASQLAFESEKLAKQERCAECSAPLQQLKTEFEKVASALRELTR